MAALANFVAGAVVGAVHGRVLLVLVEADSSGVSAGAE